MQRRRLVVSLVIVSLVLTSCGPGELLGPRPTITPTPTATNTVTPTSTSTSTSTLTPTSTSTKTVTPTRTLTPTPRPTLTPTLDLTATAGVDFCEFLYGAAARIMTCGLPGGQDFCNDTISEIGPASAHLLQILSADMQQDIKDSTQAILAYGKTALAEYSACNPLPATTTGVYACATRMAQSSVKIRAMSELVDTLGSKYHCKTQ